MRSVPTATDQHATIGDAHLMDGNVHIIATVPVCRALVNDRSTHQASFTRRTA